MVKFINAVVVYFCFVVFVMIAFRVDAVFCIALCAAGSIYPIALVPEYLSVRLPAGCRLSSVAIDRRIPRRILSETLTLSKDLPHAVQLPTTGTVLHTVHRKS